MTKSRSELKKVLASSYAHSTEYESQLESRSVFPAAQSIAALSGFDEPVSQAGNSAEETISMLHMLGAPATVSTTGGRYFGFVTGGVLPVAQAANWTAGIWDQNPAVKVLSPVAHKLEQVAGDWIKDLLKLPAKSAVSFVTGATMASFTAMAAARCELLDRQGWDLSQRGLFGAPAIRVIVSAETHVTIFKALSLLGFGKAQIEVVPVDAQGRMKIDHLPKLDETCLVLCQAGNVNSGAFDDISSIIDQASGAWVHVDGAFGLWARLVPSLKPYLNGVERADSWSVDGHKWLNTPYDCGIAITRDVSALRRALDTNAAYLPSGGQMEPKDIVPEFSRRARAIEVWAALRTLGRDGMTKMLERHCRQARIFADGLQEIGYQIRNEVVLNQVVASIGSREQMLQIQTEVVKDGVCWFGTTHWQGHDAFRISVSCWRTTDEDVIKSLTAIGQATRNVMQG